MPAVVSCGVVLLGLERTLFACHATGTARWDLPKGLADAGEAPRAAAVREAWEESGLLLETAALRDLGEFAYLSGKRLHLFAAHVAAGAFALADCRCRSFFPHHRTGVATPEADGFAWQPLSSLDRWSGKGLAKVLSALPWGEIAALPALTSIAVDTRA